jgi:hypothetical protein
MEFLIFCFFVAITMIGVAVSPTGQARRQRIANERKLKKLKDLGEAARQKNTERAVRQSVIRIMKIVDAEIRRRRSHITPNTMAMYRTLASKCRKTAHAEALVNLFDLISERYVDDTESVLRKFFASAAN